MAVAASVVNMFGARFCYNPSSSAAEGMGMSARGGRTVIKRGGSAVNFSVRAEAINPEIRKTEEKVVDSVIVSDLSKPLTAYCRCWRSGTFPLCDGSHVKHNKATGDNVGPLLLKNPK